MSFSAGSMLGAGLVLWVVSMFAMWVRERRHGRRQSAPIDTLLWIVGAIGLAVAITAILILLGVVNA